MTGKFSARSDGQNQRLPGSKSRFLPEADGRNGAVRGASCAAFFAGCRGCSFQGAFCSVLYDMIFRCFSWRHVCDAAPLGITSCRNCTSTKRTQFESPERRFALIGPSQGLSHQESYYTNFAHRTPYFRCPMGDFHGFLVQFVLNETAP